MEPSIYSRLFGGVFSTLEEYPGTASSPLYSKAVKMLDKYLETGLDNRFLVQELVDWINSPVLDTLAKSVPLHGICRWGNIELLKWFMQKYPKTNLYKQRGSYAISVACQAGHLEMVKWILENYPKEDEIIFLLDHACIGGNLDLVKWLLETYPNVPYDSVMEKAFSSACISGRYEIVKYIQEKYHLTASEETVKFVCCRGRIDILRLLIEKQEFPSLTRAKFLHWLCLSWNLDAVKEYRKMYPESLVYSEILVSLVEKGDLEMLKYLLSEFPHLDIHHDFESCFSTACRKGNLEIATWLVETYPDIDVHSDRDKALMELCETGNLEIAKWFLEKYPETDVHPDERGEPFYWELFTKGHKEMARWFMEKYPETQAGIDETWF